MRQHFPGAPYIRFYEGQPRLSIPESPVLFIDWLHEQPRRERAKLFKRRASFAIVSHVNHSREFKKAGLEYKVFRLGGLTIDRLLNIAGRRIEWARRDPNLPVPYLSRQSAVNLMATHGDDLWAIENHLYETFQELTHVGEAVIEAPKLGEKVKMRYFSLRSRIDYWG